MPTKEPYYLLHTSSMVGLFSCIFVKASERNRISNMGSAEVKRGMGGLHGNKVCTGCLKFFDYAYGLTRALSFCVS